MTRPASPQNVLATMVTTSSVQVIFQEVQNASSYDVESKYEIVIARAYPQLFRGWDNLAVLCNNRASCYPSIEVSIIVIHALRELSAQCTGWGS